MVIGAANGEGLRLAHAWRIEHEELDFDRKGLIAGWRSRGRLSEIIEHHRASIVHAHDLPSVRAAFQSCPRDVGLVWSIGADPAGLAMVDAKILQRCDRLIVTSDFEADQLLDLDVVPHDKIRVIRPSVDLREFDPTNVTGPRINELCERWHLEAGRKTILMPSPVGSGHGHAAMLEALSTLDRQDYHLVILGAHHSGDKFAASLQARADNAGHGELLRFVNACTDMPAAFALADLVVMLPERDYPVPFDILKAQALGKPAILTSVGANHELIMPAATGWLVHLGDAEELAWAIDSALDLEQNVRDRLVERARDFIASEFGIEQAGERHLALYGELTQANPHNH